MFCSCLKNIILDSLSYYLSMSAPAKENIVTIRRNIPIPKNIEDNGKEV